MPSSGLENNRASTLLSRMRSLRLPPTLLAAAVAAAALTPAAGVAAAESPAPAAPSTRLHLIRVWPQWRESDSFMGISEYFTGKETTGGWIVVRTHPESRGGFYFVTRLRNSGPTETADRFVLRLILPDSPDPRTFVLPARIPHGSHVFEVGLTGKDWTGPKLHPVAWQFEVQNAAGQVLAAQASFLWSKPGK